MEIHVWLQYRLNETPQESFWTCREDNLPWIETEIRASLMPEIHDAQSKHNTKALRNSIGATINIVSNDIYRDEWYGLELARKCVIYRAATVIMNFAVWNHIS